MKSFSFGHAECVSVAACGGSAGSSRGAVKGSLIHKVVPVPGGVKPQAAAEPACHKIIDDMQAEAGAAVAAAGGEERLEGAALDLLAHADAVVGELDLHVVAAGTADRQPHGARAPVREGVHQRIQDQVGQHLAVGAGIAVHHDLLGDIDGERDRRALQRRQQARDDLLGRLAQLEDAAFGVAAVDRDLLERLDQVGGAIEVGDELLRGLLAAGDELVELGLAHRAVADLRGELVAAPREARRHGQADADRIVDLVGDARDQAAERGELLRLDQALLRLLQLAQRGLGILLGGLELDLGLPLGDGVLAEHLDRPRHLADLVAGVGVADGLAVVAGHDRVHGGHQRPQRTDDAARDRQPDQHRDEQAQDRDDRDAQIHVGQRILEPVVGDALAPAHVVGQGIDGARDHLLIAVDRVAQQLRTGREMLGQIGDAEPPGHDAIGQRAERAALQIVVGEVEHDRDGALDGLEVLQDLLGDLARLREIERVGQHQRGRKRFPRLRERRPDQRRLLARAVLHDGVEAGHLMHRLEHLVLVGGGDRALDVAQVAEAADEPLGRLHQGLRRALEDRIGGGMHLQRRQHGLAQIRDLLQQLDIGLREVAVDEALQADGIAFELGQQPVGIARLPQLVARGRQHARAVPDDGREDDDHDGVERGDREDAPADRQLPHRMVRARRAGTSCGRPAPMPPSAANQSLGAHRSASIRLISGPNRGSVRISSRSGAVAASNGLRSIVSMTVTPASIACLRDRCSQLSHCSRM